MNRLAGALATAALLTLLLPVGTATAQDEPDETFPACGGDVSLFVVSDSFRAKEHSFGLQFTGTGTLRLADDDSSIVVRIPGRLRIEEEGGLRTFVSSGQTLITPLTPGETAAVSAFFGTDLVLVQGKTVFSERIRSDGTTIEGSQRVVSVSGRVTDLCASLAQ